MTQRNYSKIVWIVAFIVFAAVSCWATAESLHMLLSSWPKVMCWIVAVGFFIIASLGTKMIVDSFNQNIYLEKRGLRLVGGILIVLVFWLGCSMPTNTHTFIYRTVIPDKVKTDISTTQDYLIDIKENTKNKELAQRKIDELKNNVNIALGELEAEIKNEANPGFGPQSKELLRKIAALLGVPKIEPLSSKGRSKQDRDKLCDAYRAKIYALVDSKAKNIEMVISSPNPDNITEVTNIIENLSLMNKYIKEGTINLNDATDVVGSDGVCDKLNEGYNAIKKNQDFVIFASETDKANYTADNPVTKVKRMVSVFDVWTDFLKGEYKGYGFIFWIIVSILIDIAAFISFSLAFRKTEY